MYATIALAHKGYTLVIYVTTFIYNYTVHTNLCIWYITFLHHSCQIDKLKCATVHTA